MPKIKKKRPQSLRLELSNEQLKALSARAKAATAGNLTIRLVSGDEVVGELKIAAYSYHGDTCCV
jgi:cell division inhibitor SulA